MSDDAEWAALMARAQDGDQTAYRRLLKEIVPYLRMVMRSYHRNGADVEDAVQDTLLTIHSVRQTYDPARPFKPWLAAIARRRAIDRLRSLMRTRGRETLLEPEHETNLADETNRESYNGNERALRAAVEKLPPGQRQAVTLLKLQEKSLKEAALESGMSVASLKVATHRAMISLRKILSGGEEL
ncbi:MAG: sigma-70 family RNA polymerase sigma factor [Alphaproteobacteria bacterium]|nr:sigma-70 family RNA polymerase sigma factor [Alphaproteobacteria bacterium]